MKTTDKIFQVQGNGKAHYVKSTSERKAISTAKKVWPMENIDFAADFTDGFSEEEKQNLPDYVIES